MRNPNHSDTSEDVVVASELRHASDALLGRLDRLYELELRKRELPPDDPEFNRLAREIEDVALSIFGHGAQQLDLAKEVARIAKRDDSSIADQAIRDIPPGPREATVILAEWRAAERRLSEAAPGSDDEHAAKAEVDLLRDEYAETINRRNDPKLGRP